MWWKMKKRRGSRTHAGPSSRIAGRIAGHTGGHTGRSLARDSKRPFGREEKQREGGGRRERGQRGDSSGGCCYYAAGSRAGGGLLCPVSASIPRRMGVCAQGTRRRKRKRKRKRSKSRRRAGSRSGFRFGRWRVPPHREVPSRAATPRGNGIGYADPGPTMVLTLGSNPYLLPAGRWRSGECSQSAHRIHRSDHREANQHRATDGSRRVLMHPSLQRVLRLLDQNDSRATVAPLSLRADSLWLMMLWIPGRLPTSSYAEVAGAEVQRTSIAGIAADRIHISG